MVCESSFTFTTSVGILAHKTTFSSSCVIFSIVRLVYCVQFYNEYSVETDDFSRKPWTGRISQSVLSYRKFAHAVGSLCPDTVVDMIIWATVGPSTQIIAACLPTLGPLLRKQRPSSTTLLAMSSPQRGDVHSSMGTKPTKARGSQSSGSIEEQEEIAMEIAV